MGQKRGLHAHFRDRYGQARLRTRHRCPVRPLPPRAGLRNGLRALRSALEKENGTDTCDSCKRLCPNFRRFTWVCTNGEMPTSR